MYTQNSGKFYVHNGQGQAIRTYRIVVGYMYIYVMGRLIIHIQVNRKRHCAYLQQGQAQPTCRIGVGSTHMQNRDRLNAHVEQGQVIHRYICQGQVYVHIEQWYTICTYRIGVGYIYIYIRGRHCVHIQLHMYQEYRHCAHVEQGLLEQPFNSNLCKKD